MTILDHLVAEHPLDARLWSDLTAAYLVRAQRQDQPADLLRAFQAAERAVFLDAKRSEALFNRELAREALWLPPSGDRIPEVWKDPAPAEAPWAAEALNRRRRMERRLLASRQQAATSWPAMRERLPVAAAVGDSGTIRQAVVPYPAAAHRYVEETLLPAWAEASPEAPEAAREALELARLIAEELEREAGDPYLARAVERISSVASRPEGSLQVEALTRGHRSLARARRAQRTQTWTEALDHYQLARDAFAAVDSPLAASAELGAVIARFQLHASIAELVPRLAPLEETARAEGYRHLLGRVLWIRALLLTFASRPDEALGTYEQALQTFLAAGDVEDAASVRGRKAGVLRDLGEDLLAWFEAYRGVRDLPLVTELQSRHYLLGAAADAALGLSHPEVALEIQEEAVRLIEDALASSGPSGGPSLFPGPPEAGVTELRHNLSIALRHRGEILVALGERDRALTDLYEAHRLSEQATEPQVRRALRIRAREVEARALLDTDPRGALEALSEALVLAPAVEHYTFRATLHFLRSGAHRQLGDRAAEERDLRAGIEELRREERVVLAGRPGSPEPFWASYFSRFDEAYEHLIGLLVDDGRYTEGFLFAERARTLEPLNLVLQLPFVPVAFETLVRGGIAEVIGSEPPSLVDLQRTLPEGTYLFEYTVLDGRLVTWVLWRDGLRAVTRQLERRRLAEWATAFQRSAENRDASAFESALTEPYEALLGGPLAELERSGIPRDTVERLVLVPDEAIHGLPFAALRNPAGARRHLVEDFTIAVAPSASLYVYSLLRDGQIPRRRSPEILLVGDPAFDPSLDVTRGLDRLPDAMSEALELDRLYRSKGASTSLLVDDDATIPRFLDRAAASEVVHFAGHSVVNRRSPFKSWLLLASSEDSAGILRAEELLGTLALEQTRLVVLASCSSTGGVPTGPGGLAPLVRPLLAAGAPGIVGTLWDVGDRSASEFSSRFHRNYAAGADAADALRRTQLELIERRTPLVWSAFQALGHASSPFAATTTTTDTRRQSP